MMENTNQCFYYSYFRRHQGFIQAIIIITFFIPLPYWAYIILGVPVQIKAVYFTLVLGLVAAIQSILVDLKIQNQFKQIKLSQDGIWSSSGDSANFIRWNEIIGVEKIVFGDKDYYRVFGLGGIRILNRHGDNLLIYKTIKNYDHLVTIIQEKITN